MSTTISLHDIAHRRLPPEPWAEGENIPWDDPGFSQRMLEVHLSQATDLASRRQGSIDAQVAWLVDTILDGQPGRVLDLACGPGLYLHGLCARGCTGHGVDVGPASIAYAQQTAEAAALDCDFTLGDLRDTDFGSGFDLALMLYGQINVFRREDAKAILTKAYEALVPGGQLVLEPQTEEAVRDIPHPTWTSETNGLFSAAPHLLLHEAFWSAASRTRTDRWFVVGTECDGVERHAMSCVAWQPEALAALLREVGFARVDILPALGAHDGVGASLYVLHATRAEA